MLLAEVVATSRQVAETTKRLAKIDHLARLLRQLQGDEIEIVIDFLSGSTRQGRIGVGWAVLRDAAAPPAAIATLAVKEVDQTFTAITEVRGRGADQQRRSLLNTLMARATEAEQKFLTGLLLGELRQGALEGIMIDAVAKAASIEPDQIRRAVMMAGNLPVVARSVLTQGAAGLASYQIQLFRPIHPMLAQTSESVEDALVELGETALEYKFDGARVQVHKSGDDVRVYSRQLNDVTPAVPEVVEVVRALPARDLILDGEVLSETPNGRPQPFQVTMRRFGRKLDVDKLRAELPLHTYWFDLLYLNGGELLDEPQARRFKTLSELAPAEALVPHLVTADASQAEAFFNKSLQEGQEGLMAKAVNAPYMAGARGLSWRKIKQARTLDLVVLAAEWGHGRRKGWLSNLHLGARDTGKGGFAMLGKTFKGLTDEMLAWQTQELLKLEIGRDSYTVHVEPKLVVEIAFNEIQQSPHYASGLALRFARVKRYRTDKTADQSDTFQTVQQLAGLITTP